AGGSSLLLFHAAQIDFRDELAPAYRPRAGRDVLPEAHASRRGAHRVEVVERDAAAGQTGDAVLHPGVHAEAAGAEDEGLAIAERVVRAADVLLTIRCTFAGVGRHPIRQQLARLSDRSRHHRRGVRRQMARKRDLVFMTGQEKKKGERPESHRKLDTREAVKETWGAGCGT